VSIVSRGFGEKHFAHSNPFSTLFSFPLNSSFCVLSGLHMHACQGKMSWLHMHQSQRMMSDSRETTWLTSPCKHARGWTGSSNHFSSYDKKREG
jgi:hypothetical protein